MSGLFVRLELLEALDVAARVNKPHIHHIETSEAFGSVVI